MRYIIIIVVYSALCHGDGLALSAAIKKKKRIKADNIIYIT